MTISLPIIWTILIIVLLVIEGLTLNLTTIWLAIGAIGGLVLALLNVNVLIQIAVAIAITFVMLFFTRPIVKDKLKVGVNKTNVDSLIGKGGVVTKTIQKHNTGLVKVAGQIWTAKSFGNDTIEEGKDIEVMSVEGVKLIVKRSE